MASTRLSIPRGNTLILNYAQTDTSSNPISIDGASVYFTVKPTPGYDSVANDSSATWQIISTGNTGNSCTLTSTAVQTWQLPATYFWDISVVYSGGTKITPFTGTISIVGIATNEGS